MLFASEAARVLSIALILLADDYGNGRAGRALGSRVFPETPEKVRGTLAELQNMGFLVLYEVRGQHYYSIRNWKKHQRVDKPGKPRVPGPCETSEKIRETPGNIPETLAPDPDPDPDPDPERTIRAREADAQSQPSGEPQDSLDKTGTRALVSAAMAREYGRRRGVLWPASAHSVEVEQIATWVEGQARREKRQPGEVATKLLGNWFEHRWGTRCDFKPRELLKCIGEVYAPPVVQPKDEPDPDATNARRLREVKSREQRELDRKLNEHAETSSKPPPLDDLLAKIGRSV